MIPAAIQAQLLDGITLVPPHLWRGLSDHVLHGMPTGDFLFAVLANDFADAAVRADPQSSIRFRDLALFMVNHLPRGSWGSREAVLAWRARGGSGGRPSPTTLPDPVPADAAAGALSRKPETSDDQHDPHDRPARSIAAQRPHPSPRH